MTKLTIGDVAIVLGDAWARANGIVLGKTDPNAPAPAEWAAAARARIQQRINLTNAADVLDVLSAGRQPDQAMLLAGAMALETQANLVGDQDLLDASAGLRILATGGTLDLDTQGRTRAALLAAAVRKLAAA